MGQRARSLSQVRLLFLSKVFLKWDGCFCLSDIALLRRSWLDREYWTIVDESFWFRWWLIYMTFQSKLEWTNKEEIIGPFWVPLNTPAWSMRMAYRGDIFIHTSMDRHTTNLEPSWTPISIRFVMTEPNSDQEGWDFSFWTWRTAHLGNGAFEGSKKQL